MKSHRISAVILTFAMGVMIFVAYFLLGDREVPLLMQKTLENNMLNTGVDNIVMTVYLNYRLFDTLFEAMLLLVCVMGVCQFSQLSKKEKKFVEVSRVSTTDKGFSPLMTEGLQAVYIFVFIFGVYIILSGLNSPGGGFQGGAIIAAIVMSIHLSTGKTVLATESAIIIEKIMFILLLVFSIMFFLFGKHFDGALYRIFLIVINIIIGIKVFCGFVILYLQFMQTGTSRYKKVKE